LCTLMKFLSYSTNYIRSVWLYTCTIYIKQKNENDTTNEMIRKILNNLYPTSSELYMTCMHVHHDDIKIISAHQISKGISINNMWMWNYQQFICIIFSVYIFINIYICVYVQTLRDSYRLQSLALFPHQTHQ